MAQSTKALSAPKAPFLRRLRKNMCEHYQLYLLFLPALVYVLIYNYYPMYGVQIAFRNYVPARGVTGSNWVGLKHFVRFFNAYNSASLITNTLRLSLYSLILGFPLPIILAILINELRSKPLRKGVQMISYAPHFISTIAIVGMLNVIFASQGMANGVLERTFGFTVPFLSSPDIFPWMYVFSGIWQNTGWGSIIYFSALAGIDPQMHEAAMIDGATKVQRIIHIDIPSIAPTMVIMLLLNCGNIMSVGWEKAFLMQNTLNLSTSELISTYVYKTGLINADYSFSSAVGLFNSIVNLVMLTTVNAISRRLGGSSLW